MIGLTRTRGRRRRRRRRDDTPARQVLVRGGTVTVLAVVGIYLATTLYSGVPTRAYTTISATVPEVGNLISHDAVRLSGVRIGQVQDVQAGSDGKVKLTLQLEPKTELPVDSRLVVRANGLLGARYVQVVAGQSTETIADGGTIRPDAKQSITFGAPEALDTFDRQTRGRLQDTIDGLGTGLFGRGEDVNTFLRRVGDEAVPAKVLLRTVRDTGSLPTLLPNLRAAFDPLADERERFAAMTPATRRALQPFVDERGAVRDTLDRTPPALQAATTGLGNGTRLLTAVQHVSDSARRTLAYAPPALRQTSRLLTESDRPLDRAEALLRQAKPTVPEVLDITKAADPVLAPVKLLSDNLHPVVSEIGPYKCDLINFGATFRSMTGSGGTGSGPNGSLKEFRLQAIAPSSSEALSISTDNDPQFRPDPYPAPCKYLSKPYPLAVTKVPQG